MLSARKLKIYRSKLLQYRKGTVGVKNEDYVSSLARLSYKLL